MFRKNFFSRDSSRESIVEQIKLEGFNPVLISNSAGFVYQPHSHPEAKLIVCLEGSMRVKVEEEEYDFERGDKMLIPGNTLHSAVVGRKGCVFYWSEKLAEKRGD